MYGEKSTYSGEAMQSTEALNPRLVRILETIRQCNRRYSENVQRIAVSANNIMPIMSNPKGPMKDEKPQGILADIEVELSLFTERNNDLSLIAEHLIEIAG